jgi:hypothetical protein
MKKLLIGLTLLASMSSFANVDIVSAKKCVAEVAAKAYIYTPMFCYIDDLKGDRKDEFVSEVLKRSFKLHINKDQDFQVVRAYKANNLHDFINSSDSTFNASFLWEEMECWPEAAEKAGKSLLRRIKNGDLKLESCDGEFN